jgi:hypothetical protein
MGIHYTILKKIQQICDVAFFNNLFVSDFW